MSGFGFGWLDWELGFSNNFSIWLSSNFRTKFFHPFISRKSLEEDEVTHILSRLRLLSSFHPNNFRNTISWKCFLKDDSVRSSLIELQSFHHSKIDVDPFRIGWFDWKLLDSCPTSGRWACSEPNSLFQSCFKGDLGRRPRWRRNLLVYDFSSFHPNNFWNTLRWECFVMDDNVRSCFIELQSFLQSKIDVDPIYCVLMSFPCIVQVLCMTWYIQVNHIMILKICPWIHRLREYCLSVVQILTSKYQSRIDDGM